MKPTIAVITVTVFTIALAQDIGFPDRELEKAGQIPTRLSSQRLPILIPGKCPPNQLYYPGDQEHDWICDCGVGYIYYPPTDGCFLPYRQGPCKEEQYLMLPKNGVIPECLSNPCEKDGYVRYEGKCYELDQTGGPCKPASEGGGTFIVNTTTLELECGDSSTNELALINFPPNCPKGSKRGATRCRQEY